MTPLHILAVDDERDLQFLLEKKYQTPIQAGELTVHYAPDGETALACLDAHLDIAVALCDINMPGMDGLTLLRHLAGRHPYVCPIMVTAYGDLPHIRTAMHHGALDFIVKPFDFADLDATIRKAAAQAMRVRVSEEYVRRLAADARSALAVIREGQIVFVNDAWNAVFAETATALIRSNLTTLVSADAGQASFGWMPPEQREFHTHHLRGTDCDLVLKTCQWPILWDGAPAVALIAQDVTDETRRQRREARYHEALRVQVQVMRKSVSATQGFGEFIGNSDAMHQVYEQILAAAAGTLPVLLMGETGTGKDVAARMIHSLSDRSAKPFMALNCGAIPDALFEREMFGHAKGAFTGADRAQPGWFERAHHSTLLLDEVGELTPAQQVTLLRVLDSGEYWPVGGAAGKQADVRIIAATNRNVTALLRANQIRADFFHRLHGLEITLPPLRERKDDIPLLVTHFLAHAEGDRVPVRLSAAQLGQVLAYDWPGNVRELRQVMQRYATTGVLTVAADQKDSEFEPFPESVAAAELSPICQPLQQALAIFEKQHILQVLRHHRGRRADTAAALAITERHLYRKINMYGLQPSRPEHQQS